MLSTTMQPTEIDHRGQIETFVDEWIATVDPKPSHVIIAYAPLSGPPVMLDTAAAGPEKQRAAGELAERFFGAAHSHAIATGGWQRYTVAAMAGSTVLAQRMLVIETMQPARMHDPGGELGDAATIVKHLLRHDERTHRLLVEDREVSLKIMQAQLVTMSTEMQAMRQTFTDSLLEQMKVMRELGDRKHERDMELHRETQKDERQAQLLEMAQVMVPAMVARMTGATAANRLLQSIDPEVRRQLFSILDDTQEKDLRELLKIAGEGAAAERKMGAAVAEHFERIGIEAPKAVQNDDGDDETANRILQLEAEIARRDREMAELRELIAEMAAEPAERPPSEEEPPCSS